jgi:hypothetical protein
VAEEIDRQQLLTALFSEVLFPSPETQAGGE